MFSLSSDWMFSYHHWMFASTPSSSDIDQLSTFSSSDNIQFNSTPSLSDIDQLSTLSSLANIQLISTPSSSDNQLKSTPSLSDNQLKSTPSLSDSQLKFTPSLSDINQVRSTPLSSGMFKAICRLCTNIFGSRYFLTIEWIFSYRLIR